MIRARTGRHEPVVDGPGPGKRTMSGIIDHFSRIPLSQRIMLLLLVSSALLVLNGCMVKKGHTELGPLYFKRPLPDGATESAILWPFLQSYDGPRIQQYGLRPLFNVHREATDGIRGNVKEVQALWPFFLHHRSEGPTRLKIRLWPIAHYTLFHRPEGWEKVDAALYPLLFGGKSDRNGGYFALFPLGGVMKGLLGKDEIRFALFPLYADTRDKEHRSWHFLWPIFRYSKGGERSGFRFFPLFGWKHKEGWYEKLFILWPFFARVQQWQGSEHPTDSWFFIPFYVSQQTPFGRIRHFVYPLFSYQRNENPGNRFKEWQMPWPFIIVGRGDHQYWKTNVWPLWGKVRRDETYLKDFALFPIYRHYLYGNQDKESLTHRRYVLPFYWSWHLTDSEGIVTDKRIKGWPLLDFESTSRGQSRLRLLSPLWIRNAPRFQWNYGDFWTLYTRGQSPEGLLSQKILWYRWHRETPALALESGAAGTVPDRCEPSAEEPVPREPEPAGAGAVNLAPWLEDIVDPRQEP